VEWRGHYAGGAVCYGECVSSLADGSSLSVPCGAYDASEYGIKRKFERPSGVGETCQWFPPDAKIPGSGLDFGAVLVYCNFVTQLACGAFLVLFGSLGDFGANRKKGLVIGWLAFAFAPLVAGAVAPGDENDPANADATQAALILAAALYVVTSIAHLSAQQMYDAYLPLLAQTHPRVLKMMRDDSDASDASDASDVKSTAKPSPQKNIVDSSLSLTVSAATRRIASARQSAASELALRAPAMGFFSIVLITLAQLGAVLAAGEENQLKGIRWTLLVVGAWAVTVGAAGLRGIRTRPGLPPPAAPAPEPHGEAREPRTRRSTVFSLREIARLGARRTFLSVGMLRAFHPELLKLLCGQILSAITNGTMLSTYTLFVQREFGAGATDLIILLFASSVAALVSVGSFSLIAPRLDGHQLKWTLFFLKALTAIWPAWMCFGFKTKLEMWVLPVAASPFNTNILPTLRSVFQQATPRGYEAALFSLCGVCTVAFTWIGSLIVGGLLAATGSLRWGLLAVDVFVVSSLPLFYSFDPEKARADRTRIDRGEMETLDGGSRFAELRSDNARE
jgi:UMF1 family MFS transporter